MIITKNKTIDTVLKTYQKVLKSDYEVYKNHIYRIFNYAILMDGSKINDEKYAIAAVFHDLGIWTHSFDYLEPSIELAINYLKDLNNEEWIKEVKLMIDNHHKMSSYHGEFKDTVEIFRRADWIDVSKGLKLYGFDKSRYTSIQHTFSNRGFHNFLIRETSKYFIKYPLNPLPMFKR